MINEFIVRPLSAATGAVLDELIINRTSEYKVRGFDGLGPVKAEISTIDSALEPGGVYISSRDGMRNIVTAITFEPNYGSGSDITGLRRNLYKYLAPRTRVELEFDVSGLGRMIIEGYVETHEASIFAKDPAVQISFICPYPYFRKKDEQPIIRQITEILPVNYVLNLPFTIEYPLDAPVTGFEFSFKYTPSNTPSSDNVYLINDDTAKTMGVLNLEKDATYYISSQRRDRYAYEVSQGETTKGNHLGFIFGSLGSMKLYPGTNHYTLSTNFATLYRDPLPQIKYTMKYLGI